MKRDSGTDAAKRNAGESAAEVPEDGDVVGVGTGSTVAYTIRALGRRVDAGLDVRVIPTSYQSRSLAREAGLALTSLEETTPDVAIDGADQAAGVDLIKGGGAAHAREKIVATAADRFLVVVDDTKIVDTLDAPVPIEVLPDAVPVVEDGLVEIAGDPQLRAAERKDGPVVTDNGNLVVDCAFGYLPNPGEIADGIETLPGVLEHGLFVGFVDELHVGSTEGVDVRS